MLSRIRAIATQISKFEIWLACLFVGLSILRTDWLPWAALGMVLLSVVRWIAIGRWSVRTPVDGLIIMLAGTALVSLVITPLLQVTLPQVFRLITGLALFYTIINWAVTPRRAAWLASGVVALALGLAGLAIFAVQWPADKLRFIPPSIYVNFNRLVSDAVHPNVLAGNLVVVMPVALGLLLFPWGQAGLKTGPRWLLRALLTGVLVFALVILLLTQSRGAWLAFGLAGFLILSLRYRWGWLASLLLVAIGAGATWYFLDIPRLLLWLRSSLLVGEFAGRINLWARGIFILQDFFFTGIGMGTYPQTVDALYPLSGFAPFHVHNLFLQVGIDLGIPGLLAWLGILLLVVWAAWNLYRLPRKNISARQDQLWLSGLGAGLLGSQFALAFHGLFDAVTWGMIRPAPLIWGIWGVCIGAYLLLLASNSANDQSQGVL